MKKPMVKYREVDARYQSVFGDVSGIIDVARRSAARSVNAVMTAAYWLIGRHIVEFEQSGEARAEYGTALVGRLSADLTQRFGRGFSRQNLQQMRVFYLAYPPEQIRQTVSGESNQSPSQTTRQTPSGKSGNPPERNLPQIPTGQPVDPTILQTPSAESSLASIASHFPLPWPAYVRLLPVKNELARKFYEAEALRGGWSVRQINSQFYERTALSRDKAALLTRGRKARPEDHILPEGEIKDPFILEFLGLKDEYSESDLEEALISRLETFPSNWAGISSSWTGRSGFASATSGIAWTCRSSTGGCDVW